MEATAGSDERPGLPSVLVPRAHRVLRRLDPKESAFPAELVTDGDRKRVRVDAAEVAEALWRSAGMQHVAGVHDIVRRADGHDALLPWCTVTVERHLSRRDDERALTPGEIVTLGGGMLRGVEECADLVVRGTWWLDDERRPLFVPGEGVTCVAATIELCDRLRTMCADRALERVLAEIVRHPDDARSFIRHVPRWEAELTSLAAPRPLRSEPEPVFAVPTGSAIAWSSARPVQVDDLAVPASIGMRTARALRGIQAMLDTGIGRWRAGRWRAGRRVAPSAGDGRGVRARMRMLLVGATTAGAVIVGGMLWPVDDAPSTPAAAETTPASPAPAPSVVPSPAEGMTPPSSGRPSAAIEGSGAQGTAVIPPETAGVSLLALMVSCNRRGDAICGEAVVAGSGDGVLERIGEGVTGREISLVEDFGDIAVIRIGGEGKDGEQMLVLVRQEDGWRVRDAYDVADPPSERG